MILNKNGVPLEGKPKLVCLADIEKEIGKHVTIYSHAITRGGVKVTITPSPTAVAWVPAAPVAAPAVADNFHHSNLGQYLRSHEDTTESAPKCSGLVRPVFEMKTLRQPSGGGGAGGSGYVVQPVGAPGQSALWLFTTKKIEIRAGGFIFLG